MQYADWGDYRGLFLGEEIPEADFPRLARRAGDFLDYYTGGRAARAAGCPALRMACCALAEVFRRMERASRTAEPAAPARDSEGRVLRQETVGDWSVGYLSPADSAAGAARAAEYADRLEAQLAPLARRYLAGTGLLYRGGGR